MSVETTWSAFEDELGKLAGGGLITPGGSAGGYAESMKAGASLKPIPAAKFSPKEIKAESQAAFGESIPGTPQAIAAKPKSPARAWQRDKGRMKTIASMDKMMKEGAEAVIRKLAGGGLVTPGGAHGEHAKRGLPPIQADTASEGPSGKVTGGMSKLEPAGGFSVKLPPAMQGRESPLRAVDRTAARAKAALTPKPSSTPAAVAKLDK